MKLRQLRMALSLYQQHWAVSENVVTFFDPRCNRPPIEEYNRFKTRRFLSVLLSGRLVNRMRQGSLTELENYSELPEIRGT